MSLENLTETERRALNLGNLAAALLADPKTSKEAKRLLKAKNPELQFPELDTEDALEKVRQEGAEREASLRAELARRDAVQALREEEDRIREAGFDPKVIREFMTKEGITNLEHVLEFFSQKLQLAEPSADMAGVGPHRFQDVTQEDLKNMWSNPVAWREQRAGEVIKELRGGRSRRA
jgi:hypothetical protein